MKINTLFAALGIAALFTACEKKEEKAEDAKVEVEAKAEMPAQEKKEEPMAAATTAEAPEHAAPEKQEAAATTEAAPATEEKK